MSSPGHRRIVLATFGSLGDLHPFLAVALALRARGHEPVIATSEFHRERIERQGLAFHPIRPELTGMEDQPELFRRLMDRKTGTERVIREMFLPHLRASFDDLTEAVRGADLLVSHAVVFAGPLVAETTAIPWISAVLSPISLLSKYDPPVPSPAPWLKHLRPLGPAFFGPFLRQARRLIRHWAEPIDTLRRELGLPPVDDPLFADSHSPRCVLALFSKVLGAPQPDWPPQVVQTGFPFFDDIEGTGLPAALAAFLNAGDPPVVFTLGSSAVMDAGRFYEESLDAARTLGRRAVLLIGIDERNRPRTPLPASAIALDYAPYSGLFPHAAAVVHQGGVGTTAQGLRAGKPVLIVPWSHDQPDNAARVQRLGVGLTLDRERYRARTAAAALGRLLGRASFAARAAEVGRIVRAEDGAGAACDAIERALARA
jgi:UDP:flavonoid glycosyltransferase YjiC (YdhE family)